MSRKLSYVLLLLFAAAIGCSSENKAPGSSSNDSLLQKPIDPSVDTVAVAKPPTSEYWVDGSRLRTTDHLETMKRFTPGDVVSIYRGFRPLRKANADPNSDEVSAYLAEKKITLKELKAILEEGDRLGWSTAE